MKRGQHFPPEADRPSLIKNDLLLTPLANLYDVDSASGRLLLKYKIKVRPWGAEEGLTTRAPALEGPRSLRRKAWRMRRIAVRLDGEQQVAA